jgi:hypothetical protein
VPGTTASNPSITVNSGSVNIAVEGCTGLPTYLLYRHRYGRLAHHAGQ